MQKAGRAEGGYHEYANDCEHPSLNIHYWIKCGCIRSWIGGVSFCKWKTTAQRMVEPIPLLSTGGAVHLPTYQRRKASTWHTVKCGVLRGVCVWGGGGRRAGRWQVAVSGEPCSGYDVEFWKWETASWRRWAWVNRAGSENRIKLIYNSYMCRRLIVVCTRSPEIAPARFSSDFFLPIFFKSNETKWQACIHNRTFAVALPY